VLKFEAAVTNQAEIPMEIDWSEDGEENLDATKGIGYPARDDGRYGSYPSHDGFDDESEP